MNKVAYYIILIVCIILVPLCAIGFLGTMITDKYQVDHARTFVEIDSGRLTETKKQQKLTEINDLEKSVRKQQIFVFALGIGACVGTSYLLIKRKKLIKKNVAQHRL